MLSAHGLICMPILYMNGVTLGEDMVRKNNSSGSRKSEGSLFLLKLGKLTGNVQNFEKVRSNCNRNTRDFDLTLTDGKTFQLTVISALFCLNEGDGGFRTLPHLTFLFIWAG